MTSLARRLGNATAFEAAYLEAEMRWVERARFKQVLPIDGWNLALLQAGRGFGKTETGSSWVRRECGLYPGIVCHVIAPTYADLRGVVFGGSTGLLNIIPAPMIQQVNNSTFEIKLWNGSIIRGFSAETPDRLRGPQAHRVWGDEVAAWGHNAEAMIANIDLSTRLVYVTSDGKRVQPQRLYTTTPRPLEWLAKMAERDDVYHVRGTTMENQANLAEAFMDELMRYEGTQIYRQEVLGELLDIGEAAIIKRSWLKLWPKDKPLPFFEFVMVSLDTALTEKTFDKKTFEPDFTACTVWGVFAHEKKWNLMLLECWHEQLGFPDLVMRARREMQAIYGRTSEVLFKPLIGNAIVHEQEKRPDLMIIEDKGSGISLRQMLSVEGIDSWPFNPGNADKLARLHGVSHVAAAGRIWLPESRKNPGQPRDWVEPMLSEVCIYSGPGTTKHDDFVDSTSQAWRYFADRWLALGVNMPIAPDKPTDDSDMVIMEADGVTEFRNPYDA